MTLATEVAVVGAGIVGLAHAWSAAERGHRVTVFERADRAQGASIRNFGMIWPIGQPTGDLHEMALESRHRWLRVAESAGIWVNPCGSIHLAHRTDEFDVLQEFHERAESPGLGSLGFKCSWLTPEQVLDRSPAVNPQGLLGGLFSPTEMCVNPRVAIHQLPRWLAEIFGVRCEFQTQITNIESGRLVSSDGRRWEADRIVICSGSDFETLLPSAFHESGMKRCKLQMLKTCVQGNGWRIGPHLASGLTLRHYRNFEVCSALNALQRRIAEETPELDRFGIHVMMSQNEAGEVVLGDSHEYGSQIEPFDKVEIDDLILRELKKVMQLPDWTIAQRWNGIYAKHPTNAWFECEPTPNVHVCTGLGGSGMTMSFGLAEHCWRRWDP
ncbi:MAG: TIGR03364 family FAD-dependent oxidoreductase [Planctomycetales bacterium]|nr:TIGR03364 family FAD-dependent oxidoreductase [Planctomycetales bacterium]MCA9164343.1 TIGR03364 family FAD-dependent oxidoreductase [Planctomycetales bacterium]MCB9922011.1 TIGR03364 family FAD-dependent oxidoreductase [Planctomycetaceae bacterium]